MRILNSKEIDIAVSALQSGDVVGIPTETVYGLAGNAFDENAVTKIFVAKNRPTFDPLIVHVEKRWMSLSELSKRRIVAAEILSFKATTTCEKIFKFLCPGPLTLILPKGKSIPDLVTSGKAFVGIRSPNHPLAQKILERSQLPLAAPSANRFGKVSPTTANHVVSELDGKIPYVVDGGMCEVGVESTVITVNDDGSVSILRPGFFSENDFKKLNINVSNAGLEKRVTAPGQLDSHYAPDKLMIYVENGEGFLDVVKSGSAHLLLPHPVEKYHPSLQKLAQFSQHKKFLSETNDDSIAAKNLFSFMLTMNQDSSCHQILVLPVLENHGLWLAIKDRLTRASKPS